jgi:hypothetical protein
MGVHKFFCFSAKYKNIFIPPISSADRLCVHKPPFFGLQKIRELYMLCLRAVWCLPNGGFVHQIKMCPQIGRRFLLYTSRLLKNEEIICIFVFSGCAAIYCTTQLPAHQNSLMAARAIPPFCLSPGTARRQRNLEVKRFIRATLYSVNICRQL